MLESASGSAGTLAVVGLAGAAGGGPSMQSYTVMLRTNSGLEMRSASSRTTSSKRTSGAVYSSSGSCGTARMKVGGIESMGTEMPVFGGRFSSGYDVPLGSGDATTFSVDSDSPTCRSVSPLSTWAREDIATTSATTVFFSSAGTSSSSEGGDKEAPSDSSLPSPSLLSPSDCSPSVDTAKSAEPWPSEHAAAPSNPQTS
mmetsp:Transcript_108559/g.306030  ORF Transcript_108559/g.306030 Transcript_108559/m.306030 type:complete len:200 (-) Transcript_108559:530-1129(-)